LASTLKLSIKHPLLKITAYCIHYLPALKCNLTTHFNYQLLIHHKKIFENPPRTRPDKSTEGYIQQDLIPCDIILCALRSDSRLPITHIKQ